MSQPPRPTAQHVDGWMCQCGEIHGSEWGSCTTGTRVCTAPAGHAGWLDCTVHAPTAPPPPHAPSGEPDLETIRAEWVYFDSEGDPAAAQVHWLVAEVERLRAALAQRDQAIAELRGELAGCVTVAEEIERRHAAVAQLAATLTLARQQRDEYLRELKLTRPVAEAGRGVLACLRGSAHRNDLAPIVEVCRVLLTTSQVTDLTAALQALDAAFRARGETNG